MLGIALMPDVLIVGAGFSGAVMAERFASQSNKSVLVLEQREHIGGNCYDYKNEAGIYVHRYGPHLFHTNKKRVWEYLSQFTEWHFYEHQVLSHVDHQMVPMPFNLNSLHAYFQVEQAKTLETLLIQHYGTGTRVSIMDLRQHEHEQLRALGQTVYDRFFLNYTTKQWGCSPEAISPEVIARVPVLIERDNRYFQDRYQAIPKQGYTAVFKELLSHPSIEMQLQQDALQRLRFEKATGDIYFDGELFTGQVIYTGMLDELFNYSNGELPYRSLQFVLETLDEEEFQPVTTVNYPNEEAFTRITEFKHILPVNSTKTTIVREYPQDFDRNDTEKNIPYYPVFKEENERNHAEYLRLVKRFPTLAVLGRLADYKYYNMDDAIDRALSLFEARYVP